ncbi:MAG: hypothetical protein U0470_06710 [Anaerolineae bacterium]
MPASYLICGPVIDFADARDRVAEDQVQYTCLDATGERREYAVGELGILRGITLARQPWQAYAGGGMDVAVSTVPLYSVIAPLPDPTGETGLAMLFEPTIPGASNEAAFRSFVRMTIGRLLVLDEPSRPPAGAATWTWRAGWPACRPRAGSSGRWYPCAAWASSTSTTAGCATCSGAASSSRAA